MLNFSFFFFLMELIETFSLEWYSKSIEMDEIEVCSLTDIRQ